VVGNGRGENRRHVNVGRRVAKPGDRAQQAGFREWNQRLGYPGGKRYRLVGRCRKRRFLAAANADAHAARGVELLDRCSGILTAQHGGEQARGINTGGEGERCRRYPQQDHDRVAALVSSQRSEVAESSGGGATTHRVQLADQFCPQPCCFFRVAAHGVQQQRLTSVGKGGVLGRRSYIVRLDRQRKDPLGYLGAKHAAPRTEIRHLAGLRLIQLVAPYPRAAWSRLRDLSAAGSCLPVLAQPVQLHVPLGAPRPPQLDSPEDAQEPKGEDNR
jgi:hypothetical protein